MFWDKYVELCNKVGKSPSAVAIEMGFSNASAVGWKKGAVPRPTTLLKIANYFNIPVSDLTGEGQKEKPAHDVDEPMKEKLRDALLQITDMNDFLRFKKEIDEEFNKKLLALVEEAGKKITPSDEGA